MRIFFVLVLAVVLLVGFPILVCMVCESLRAHYKISTTEMLLGCIALGVLFPNWAQRLK